MSSKRITWYLVLLFAITRVYIWLAKPVEFTQIIAVYMPYAHLWASGIKPYLEQWYEYPPATIPLFYLPHLIDMFTLRFAWHINYAVAYRGMILIIDVGIFALIISFLKKLRVRRSVYIGALLYYSLATAKAHDFIYDSMDLVFAAALSFGLIAPTIFKGLRGRVLGWFGYFMAVGLKLINAPLGLIYAILERKHLKKTMIAVLFSGLLVWAVPLIMFRSSLSVMLVYHSIRGLQVESVPAQIASVIDKFTHSEQFVNKYQSMNIVGPVSEGVTSIFNSLFYIALISFTVWGCYQAWHTSAKKRLHIGLSLSLAYIFLFMFFAKVLSTPYHLWPIPLLALYPFKTLKQQLSFILPSFLMITLSMTKIPDFQIGMFNLHLLIGISRSIIICYLLLQSIKLVQRIKMSNNI